MIGAAVIYYGTVPVQRLKIDGCKVSHCESCAIYAYGSLRVAPHRRRCSGIVLSEEGMEPIMPSKLTTGEGPAARYNDVIIE